MLNFKIKLYSAFHFVSKMVKGYKGDLYSSITYIPEMWLMSLLSFFMV